MTVARNRRAYERGQAARTEILGILARHPAIAAPLTAKQIQPMLGCPLSERAVQWHMQQIRCGCRNVSR